MKSKYRTRVSTNACATVILTVMVYIFMIFTIIKVVPNILLGCSEDIISEPVDIYSNIDEFLFNREWVRDGATYDHMEVTTFYDRSYDSIMPTSWMNISTHVYGRLVFEYDIELIWVKSNRVEYLHEHLESAFTGNRRYFDIYVDNTSLTINEFLCNLATPCVEGRKMTFTSDPIK